jgi:hypothetical protein
MVIPLGIYLKTVLLDHMVLLFLVFLVTSILISIGTTVIYILTNTV